MPLAQRTRCRYRCLVCRQLWRGLTPRRTHRRWCETCQRVQVFERVHGIVAADWPPPARG
jgi:hypothetical protein